MRDYATVEPICTIKYGGKDITVKPFSTNRDLLLIYKEHKLLFSQIKKFVDIPSWKSKRLIAGLDINKRVPITESHNGNINIGCLSDTKENFNHLFTKLSKLN